MPKLSKVKDLTKALGFGKSFRKDKKASASSDAPYGEAESNGFPYRYSVALGEEFIDYTITLYDGLLLAKGDYILTEPFYVGNTGWSIKLQNDESGYLIGSLVSLNDTAQNVHMTATLICPKNKENNRTNGFSKCMIEAEEFSFFKFQNALIQSRQAGYIHESKFTIKILIRLASTESERHAVYSSGNKAYITWSFRDLAAACPHSIASEYIDIGDNQWFLIALPKGNTYKKDFMVVFNAKEEATYDLNITSTALDPQFPIQSKTKEHIFSEVDAGVVESIADANAFEKPNSPFLKDGWFTIGLYLKISRHIPEEIAPIRTVKMRLLATEVNLADLHPTYTIGTNWCTFDKEYDIDATQELTCITKFLRSGDQSNLLKDYWLCNLVGENQDKLELVQRATYLDLCCKTLKDLCGNADQRIVFLYTVQSRMSVSNLSEIARRNMDLYKFCETDNSFTLVDTQSPTEGGDSSRLMTDSHCIICHDAPATHGFTHGNEIHKCACESCALRIRARRDPCPICRREVHDVMRVYDN